PLGLRGAAVGGLHDARATTGADHEAAAFTLQLLGPVGEAPRQFARGLVIARHVEVALRDAGVLPSRARFLQDALGVLARPEAGGSHEYDGVFDRMMAEATRGLEIFRQDA